MAANIDDDDDAIASINVTPFVDVVLVLLVMLMVTSTQIVRAQLMVDLPQAASGGETVPSTLNITLLKDGSLLLDGSPATGEDLIETVERLRRTDPKAQAVIAADQGVAYGRVVAVIDAVKTNGISSFALNIEKVEAPVDLGP